jgi:putative Mn2+ efflux pump MntP
LEIHRDLIVLGKTLTVALAVGLDVLAVSVGVGVAQLAREASLKLGTAFAGSEITMQVVGCEPGVVARRVLGEIGAQVGFALLAFVGALMIGNSLGQTHETDFKARRGVGLLMTSLSVRLDSRHRGPGQPCPT